MKIFTILILFILTVGCIPEDDPTPKKNRGFIITHVMKYKNEVDLTLYGVARNEIIYETSLLSPRDKEEPLPESELKVIADSLQGGGALPTMIAIGQWSIYINDSLKRDENLKKLIFVIETLRKARPDLQFGYYGVVPQRYYEPLVDAKLNEWLAFNEAAKADFVPHVDAIFPTLFTTNENAQGWKTFAIRTLTEARKFNKPVYAVLRPKFHESNPLLSGQYLPSEYWRLELEVCFNYCDGIVLQNNEPTKKWNPNDSWWMETLAFKEAIKAVADQQAGK